MTNTVKLIIEIPKNYLETIKHTVRNTAENGNTPLALEIIANGIPLNNNYTVPNECVDYQDRAGADMRDKNNC